MNNYSSLVIQTVVFLVVVFVVLLLFKITISGAIVISVVMAAIHFIFRFFPILRNKK
jgi:5-bromo-4-chloroindolyl phosphate hydrolysis protein